MATVYKFKVRCCSAFLSYPDKQIAEYLEKALKDFEDEKTGLKLESISVSKHLDKARLG